MKQLRTERIAVLVDGDLALDSLHSFATVNAGHGLGQSGRNAFRKDKSGEKLAVSEEDPLEHRTDGSDAFDTLYIGCEKSPTTTSSRSVCKAYYELFSVD